MNGCPSLPTRICRKNTGPPSSEHDGERDDREQRADSSTAAAGATALSKTLLTTRLAPLSSAWSTCSSGSPATGRIVVRGPGDIHQGRRHAQIGAGLLQLPGEPAQPDAVHLGAGEHGHRVRAELAGRLATLSSPPYTGTPSISSGWCGRPGRRPPPPARGSCHGAAADQVGHRLGMADRRHPRMQRPVRCRCSCLRSPYRAAGSRRWPGQGDENVAAGDLSLKA